jgi:ribosomal protein S18 acetylase RimI-like enzyme
MISFKQISQHDIPEAVEMMEDFYAIDNYPINIAKSTSLMDEFVADNSLGKGWRILHKVNTAGYVIMTFVFSFEYGGRIAFLDELYIRADYRNLGLARAAVDFVITDAQQANVKLIYLELEKHNEAARHLYLSKNFLPHGRDLLKLKLDAPD